MDCQFLYHDSILVPENYQPFLHWLMQSCGQPRTSLITGIVNSMIIFFVNTFLAMTCVSGYNETNVNRLLVNYSPEASDKLSNQLVYPALRSFKNMYWGKSHCANWDSFPILMKVFEKRTSLQAISKADIVMCLIFLTATGKIRINPRYLLGWMTGEPFYFRTLMNQYWFSRGLRYDLRCELQFAQTNFLEHRRLKYLSRGKNPFLREEKDVCSVGPSVS